MGHWFRRHSYSTDRDIYLDDIVYVRDRVIYFDVIVRDRDIYLHDIVSYL